MGILQHPRQGGSPFLFEYKDETESHVSTMPLAGASDDEEEVGRRNSYSPFGIPLRFTPVNVPQNNYSSIFCVPPFFGPPSSTTPTATLATTAPTNEHSSPTSASPSTWL